MDDWKKVEPNKIEAWDADKESEVEGTLKQVKAKVGPNESMMYILKREGKEDIAVWGSTVIDHRMAEIELGKDVKIVYLGKEKGEKSGREYRNYEVYTRPEPPKPDFVKTPSKFEDDAPLPEEQM